MRSGVRSAARSTLRPIRFRPGQPRQIPQLHHPPYYYVPPQQAQYAPQEEDPAKKERHRAEERRLAAIQAPTGIVANGSAGNAVTQPRSVDPIQASLDRMAQISAAANNMPRPVVGGGYPTLGPSAAMSEEADLNQQNGKRKFQQEEEGDYLKTTRIAPLSRWVVERGDKIVAILPTRVVSDLPGDLVAQVKDDVYDSPTHKFIMIPAGSLLAGEFNSSVSYGQGPRSSGLDLLAVSGWQLHQPGQICRACGRWGCRIERSDRQPHQAVSRGCFAQFTLRRRHSD